MTAKQLLARAAECQTCGREHKPRRERSCTTWAARSDGHSYRPRIPAHVLPTLRELAA